MIHLNEVYKGDINRTWLCTQVHSVLTDPNEQQFSMHTIMNNMPTGVP